MAGDSLLDVREFLREYAERWSMRVI